MFLQVKYYNAEQFEVEQYREAILNYQVRTGFEKTGFCEENLLGWIFDFGVFTSEGHVLLDHRKCSHGPNRLELLLSD